MDSQEKFELSPFPIETEFRVLSVKRRLGELTREELEQFLTEALAVSAKLAHQLTQLREYLQKIEGMAK